MDHPFAQMLQMGGASSFAPLGQARATVAMTMMAACYNLKRMAKFLDDGVGCVLQVRGMPARGQCVRNGGKNAIEEAMLLKKKWVGL